MRSGGVTEEIREVGVGIGIGIGIERMFIGLIRERSRYRYRPRLRTSSSETPENVAAWRHAEEADATLWAAEQAKRQEQ